MRILLLLLAALGGYFLLRHLYRESGVKIYQIILGIVAITLIALVILGKAHWLMAVAGGLLAIFGKAFLVGFRFLPLFRFAYQAYVGTKQHIKFRSRWIEITVQRASGEIEGMVLRGPLRGRALSSLGPKELQELEQACAEDKRSAALLRTYLQYAHPSWKTGAGGSAESDAFEEGPMSVSTAYKILNVSPGAGEEEIRMAYRKLAQKLHPDRGGSDYLTRKINEARDVLLRNRK